MKADSKLVTVGDLERAQRIAIIGAGAAGLTAAEELKDKGYQNITVFERTDRAGGKCSEEHSFTTMHNQSNNQNQSPLGCNEQQHLDCGLFSLSGNVDRNRTVVVTSMMFRRDRKP